MNRMDDNKAIEIFLLGHGTPWRSLSRVRSLRRRMVDIMFNIDLDLRLAIALAYIFCGHLFFKRNRLCPNHHSES